MPREKITIIESNCVPMMIDSIDTDQIIPARFLKATTRDGFGQNLFRDWRYNPDNTLKTDFVLNDSTYTGKILVTGKNYGCGSSREHAAWAVYDYGFRVIVAQSYSDIFYNNALNNGILPIRASEDFVNNLAELVLSNPKTIVTVDLVHQLILVNNTGEKESFEINAYKKECLINGYDDIDYLINQKQIIETFEQKINYIF